MARIRTVKPEFADSESMGRISRDARLLFVIMWTIADDAGRLRGASRLIASKAFPYDEDAPSLVDGWLDELEREGCIRRYVVEGSRYIAITNWSAHQRIERASESKLPTPDDTREGSRVLGEDSPSDHRVITEPSPPRARAPEVDLGVGIDLGGDQNQQHGTTCAVPALAKPSNGNGAPPPTDAWQPFYDAVSVSLGGVDVRRRDGDVVAGVGKLAFIAGRFSDDDVGKSIALWRRYAASDEWQFRPRRLDKLHEAFGPWADEWARFDVGVQR